MNIYTPGEMVRLELLAYPTPEGLHPVEHNWRELCRKLLQDVQTLEKANISHGHYNSPDKDCFKCNIIEQLPRKWPTAFI